jgi:hypothetical protein
MPRGWRERVDGSPACEESLHASVGVRVSVSLPTRLDRGGRGGCSPRVKCGGAKSSDKRTFDSEKHTFFKACAKNGIGAKTYGLFGNHHRRMERTPTIINHAPNMSQGKALIAGALKGYLPSVSPTHSTYDAVPVGLRSTATFSVRPGHTWQVGPAEDENESGGAAT